MKITQIKVYNVEVKLKKPLKIAKMLREKSSNSIVKIETDDGIQGYGEATFAPFFAGETRDSVKGVVEKFLAPALTGQDPTNIFQLVDEMSRTIADNPFAKASVEMALWDIKGKALGVPVYDLCGGFRRKSFAPFSSAAIFSLVSETTVSTMTGISLRSSLPLISLSTSRP